MILSSFLLCDLHLIWYFLIYFILLNFNFPVCFIFSICGLLFLPTVVDKWSSLRDFFYFLLVLHHTFILCSLLHTYFRVLLFLCSSINIGVLFHLLLILLYGLLSLTVFPAKNVFLCVLLLLFVEGRGTTI